MTAEIKIYDSFQKYMGDGTIDLDNDTFKVALVSSSYTPSASHTTFSDITDELPTAFGYISGGNTLSSISWTQTGNIIVWNAASTAWDAIGGDIVARYAVIYKSGTSNSIVDPLVAYILLDNTHADVTIIDTRSLLLKFDPAGIFDLTNV